MVDPHDGTQDMLEEVILEEQKTEQWLPGAGYGDKC